MGGEEEKAVRITVQDIQNKLNEEGIEVPSAKCQGPSKEVKFLGTWWIAGQAVIPNETITKLDTISTPTTKKELQQIMGTLGYWRNHVPGFSIIARPLYTLMKKHQNWEQLDNHQQALQTLIEELKTYQSLEPVHPSDSMIVEWGFAEHRTHCNLFQKGPHGPKKRPLGFSSTALKDAERRYTDWEKGLLSLTRALKQVEKIRQQQPVTV